MNKLIRSLSGLTAWILQPLLVIAILVVGFVVANRLSLRRQPPQRSETAVYAPLVRAITTEHTSFPIVVYGNGSLEARTRIAVTPQVKGEVVEIHPGLRDGGTFRAGELLVRIEARDYELAIARTEAEVASAESVVFTTRAESESAIAEWEQARPGEECPPLVRLEPQLKSAEARVLTVEAQLEQAKLDLARTVISLPFDGRVIEASVDVGEVVSTNQPVAEVYATDILEVAIPLRAEELAWLALPVGANDESASMAVVRGMGAGGPIEVRGRISRLYGQLDPKSRMARVVIEIDTTELDATMASRLLPGTFVDAEIQARTLEEVVELPRGAIREGGRVWVIEEERLRFAEPELVYQGNGSVLVRGLSAGARVITSNLEVVTDGMQVRLNEQGAL